MTQNTRKGKNDFYYRANTERKNMHRKPLLQRQRKHDQNHFSTKSNQKRKENIHRQMVEVRNMKQEYDIKNLNPRKNPYAKQLKRQITINIDGNTIDFFKAQSQSAGIPYQTLINLYLRDCSKQQETTKPIMANKKQGVQYSTPCFSTHQDKHNNL